MPGNHARWIMEFQICNRVQEFTPFIIRLEDICACHYFKE